MQEILCSFYPIAANRYMLVKAILDGLSPLNAFVTYPFTYKTYESYYRQYYQTKQDLLKGGYL